MNFQRKMKEFFFLAAFREDLFFLLFCYQFIMTFISLNKLSEC